MSRNPLEDWKPPEEEAKIRRRNFLKAATALTLGAEGASRMSAGEFPNMREVETEQAIYRIFYDLHTISEAGETVRGADALIPELPEFNYRQYELPSETQISSLDTEWGQYREIYQVAKELGTPLFYCDFSLAHKKNMEYIPMAMHAIQGGLEVYLGLNLIEKSLKTPEPLQTNRREFLRRAAQGLLGAYLLTPGAEAATQLLATNLFTALPVESSLSRQSNRSLRRLNEIVHPEFALYEKVVTLRNSLIAEKAEHVAGILGRVLGRKPVINIYIGAGHTGIELELKKSSDQRISELVTGLGEELTAEGSIAVVEWNPKGWVHISLIEDKLFDEAARKNE